MIGSAEFLLPDGSIVPASRWPPSTMYWIGGTGAVPNMIPRLHYSKFCSKING